MLNLNCDQVTSSAGSKRTNIRSARKPASPKDSLRKYSKNLASTTGADTKQRNKAMAQSQTKMALA